MPNGANSLDNPNVIVPLVPSYPGMSVGGGASTQQ